AELEDFAGQSMQSRLRASQECPALRLGVIALTVFCERCGCVVLGVDGEGNKPGIRYNGQFRLDFAHLRRHAWTWAAAGREDEVGDPDLSFERSTAKGLSGFVGQFEVADGTVGRQIRRSSARRHDNQRGTNCGASTPINR